MRHKDLYNTARWKRLRLSQLFRHPRCQCEHHAGLSTSPEACVVDHIKPHGGDLRMFYDPRNLQSMAKECHDRYKQSQERGGRGFLGACDEAGWPVARTHEWNQA